MLVKKRHFSYEKRSFCLFLFICFVLVHFSYKSVKSSGYKIISKHIDTSTIIYSDECSSYNYLKVKRYHHETVIYSKREFVKGSVNTNSIESFWSFCKRRFNKFNGINRNNFHLHLKECEFRFNNRNKNLRTEIIKVLSKNSYLFFLLYNLSFTVNTHNTIKRQKKSL